jgi:hypothetical protein
MVARRCLVRTGKVLYIFFLFVEHEHEQAEQHRQLVPEVTS